MLKYSMILYEAYRLKLMRKQQRRRKRRRLLIFHMISVWCWCEIEALVMPVRNGYSTRSMEICPPPTPIVFHNRGGIKDAALCPAGRSAVRKGDAPQSLHSFVTMSHNEDCATFLIGSLSCLQSMCRHWGLATPFALVLCGFAAGNWI